MRQKAFIVVDHIFNNSFNPASLLRTLKKIRLDRRCLCLPISLLFLIDRNSY